MDTDDDKTYILDKRGRRVDYIESDGMIKDKYGRKGKLRITINYSIFEEK